MPLEAGVLWYQGATDCLRIQNHLKVLPRFYGFENGKSTSGKCWGEQRLGRRRGRCWGSTEGHCKRKKVSKKERKKSSPKRPELWSDQDITWGHKGQQKLTTDSTMQKPRIWRGGMAEKKPQQNMQSCYLCKQMLVLDHQVPICKYIYWVV